MVLKALDDVGLIGLRCQADIPVNHDGYISGGSVDRSLHLRLKPFRSFIVEYFSEELSFNIFIKRERVLV